jgi:hypothetical protein
MIVRSDSTDRRASCWGEIQIAFSRRAYNLQEYRLTGDEWYQAVWWAIRRISRA